MLEAEQSAPAGDEGVASLKREGAAQCLPPSDLAAVNGEHRAGGKG